MVSSIEPDNYLPNGEKIPYDASRPIRTVVATASAKAPPKKVISKVTFVENYQSDEEESTARFRDNSRFEADLEEAVSSLNQIEWDPPILNSDNYGKVKFAANGMTTRAEALRGRRRESSEYKERMHTL